MEVGAGGKVTVMTVIRTKRIHSSDLAFGELEALAGLGLAGFLTFNGTRVAGHEAMLAEGRLVFGIDFDKSASDAETESFCLSFVAAAVEIDMDIVFVGNFKSVERLLNDILKNRRGEVYVEGTLIDGDGTVSFFEDYASYCCFTTANCIYCFHCVGYFSLLMSITVGF